MRALLDEHFSPRLAQVLRSRGLDVETAAERRDLRSKSDQQILVVAATERRVLVTENARDFAPLGSRRLPDKKPHAGVILVSPRTFARGRANVGRLLRALEPVFLAHSDDDDLVGNVIWLAPAADDPD